MSARAKGTVVALCLVAALGCLSGCGGSSEGAASDAGSDQAPSEQQDATPSYVGVWEPSSVSTDGVISTEASVLVNYDYRFVLNEDGTATVRVLGADISSFYAVDGDVITFADDQLSAVQLEMDGDDTLVLSDPLANVRVSFSRAE